MKGMPKEGGEKEPFFRPLHSRKAINVEQSPTLWSKEEGGKTITAKRSPTKTKQSYPDYFNAWGKGVGKISNSAWFTGIWNQGRSATNRRWREEKQLTYLGLGKRIDWLDWYLLSFHIRRINPSMKEALRFGCQSSLSKPDSSSLATN